MEYLKDYTEYIVRRKLGQHLLSFDDYLSFKKERSDDFDDKPNHLRLNMTGQRDSDGGIYQNQAIFKMFNLPITIKWSNYEYDYDSNDFGNLFIFHKGTPTLFQRMEYGGVVEIATYNGYGTVDILVDLIHRFLSVPQIIDNIFK